MPVFFLLFHLRRVKSYCNYHFLNVYSFSFIVFFLSYQFKAFQFSGFNRDGLSFVNKVMCSLSFCGGSQQLFRTVQSHVPAISRQNLSVFCCCFYIIFYFWFLLLFFVNCFVHRFLLANGAGSAM